MAELTNRPRTQIDDLPFSALGGQPVFAPGTLEAFVRAPRIATLAYLRRDGRPSQAPIWYVYQDSVFLMVTNTDSLKHRALKRDPRVCLTIQDERPPYRALIADGEVELSSIDPAANPTAGIAMRYFGRLGAAEYERMTAAEDERTGLTLIALRPTALRGFDNTLAVSRAVLAFVRLRDWLPIPRGWL